MTNHHNLAKSISMENRFVWADLSTFNIEQAKDFYLHCFGWQYADATRGYQISETNQLATAGLYPMPEQFVTMGMPSFWMSYIQVEDIEQVVDKAKAHGAIIEIPKEQWWDNSYYTNPHNDLVTQ